MATTAIQTAPSEAEIRAALERRFDVGLRFAAAYPDAPRKVDAA